MSTPRSPITIAAHDFVGGHPPDAALVEQPWRAIVQTHARGCPRCRTRARALRAGVEEARTALTPPAGERRPQTPQPIGRALQGAPGQLYAMVRAVITELQHAHAAGLSWDGLQDEPLVDPDGQTRLLGTPVPCTDETRRADWSSLAGWMRGWRAEAPGRGLEVLIDHLQAGPVEPAEGLLDAVERTYRDVAEYADHGLIDAGGMGAVYRIHDALLGRHVAMKVLRPDRRDEVSQLRFLDEARLTAQLDHPGIVPVHRLGRLPDGGAYYTMRLVRGRSFAELIRALHEVCTGISWGRTEDGWTLRRAVDALARVSDALAFAHSRGIVHRDIKPANIMVGAFGEVQVMDWGVALDTSTEVSEEGEVVGTPRFMSPEQARGSSALDARSDVYAMGATLFSLLVGRPPHAELTRTQLDETLRRETPLQVPADGPPIPQDLLELVVHATAPLSARPGDAGAFGEQLRSWLDGEARTDRADAATASALGQKNRANELADRAETLRKHAEQALERVASWAPVEEKRTHWAAIDQALSLEREAAVVEAEVEQSLRAALDHDPEHRHALDTLAELIQDRLLRAEARGDARTIARLSAQLEQHDGGRHRAWLDGSGLVSIRTDPPGARVIAHDLVERDRRLVPGPGRELGTSPLDVELPRGSSLLTLDFPGRPPVTYPVFVDRGAHWSGIAPDEQGTRPIRIPAVGALEKEEVYVPAGWFLAGGDEHAIDAFPRRWVWCEAFAIWRHPVTHGEYLAFINDLVRQGRPKEAARHAPAIEQTTSATAQYYILGQDGRYSLGRTPISEQPLVPDLPVTGISMQDAIAWCAWRREGLRLPHELEWSKAARGVDGRAFAWGDRFEATYADCLPSKRGRALPDPVGAYPIDTSPYGVQGTTGGVRERCANRWTKQPPSAQLTLTEPAEGDFGVIRGGSFGSVENFCRSASRFGAKPPQRVYMLGFRPCRSLGSSGLD